MNFGTVIPFGMPCPSAMKPICVKSGDESRWQLWPNTSARPAFAFSRFIRICSIVLLPAPFGPSSAYTLPSDIRLNDASVEQAPL